MFFHNIVFTVVCLVFHIVNVTCCYSWSRRHTAQSKGIQDDKVDSTPQIMNTPPSTIVPEYKTCDIPSQSVMNGSHLPYYLKYGRETTHTSIPFTVTKIPSYVTSYNVLKGKKNDLVPFVSKNITWNNDSSSKELHPIPISLSFQTKSTHTMRFYLQLNKEREICLLQELFIVQYNSEDVDASNCRNPILNYTIDYEKYTNNKCEHENHSGYMIGAGVGVVLFVICIIACCFIGCKRYLTSCQREQKLNYADIDLASTKYNKVYVNNEEAPYAEIVGVISTNGVS